MTRCGKDHMSDSQKSLCLRFVHASSCSRLYSFHDCSLFVSTLPTHAAAVPLGSPPTFGTPFQDVDIESEISCTTIRSIHMYLLSIVRIFFADTNTETRNMCRALLVRRREEVVIALAHASGGRRNI